MSTNRYHFSHNNDVEMKHLMDHISVFLYNKQSQGINFGASLSVLNVLLLFLL